MGDEEQAMLSAICLNPTEDLPRLVYADWLDDHDGQVKCPQASGYICPMINHKPCHVCKGAGTVSNHFAARAEFIRLQCEFEHLSDTDRQCPLIEEPRLGQMWQVRWREGKCQCKGCVSKRRQAQLLGHRLPRRPYHQPSDSYRSPSSGPGTGRRITAGTAGDLHGPSQGQQVHVPAQRRPQRSDNGGAQERALSDA